MKSRKGYFITFEETIPGLGSEAQARRLKDNLSRICVEAVLTSEPGGTQTGQKLLEILNDHSVKLSRAAELFIVLADRSQHYKEVLKPSLKSGKTVVCDHYFDSTLVNLGSMCGWKTAFLLRLHQTATGLLFPDLTIVLDSDLICANKRIRESTLYFASKSDRYIVIAGYAQEKEEQVSEQIFDIVKSRLKDY